MLLCCVCALQTSSSRSIKEPAAARAVDEAPHVPESDGPAGGSDDDVDNEAAIVIARNKMRSNPNVLPSSAGLMLDELRWRKRHALEPGEKVD